MRSQSGTQVQKSAKWSDTSSRSDHNDRGGERLRMMEVLQFLWTHEYWQADTIAVVLETIDLFIEVADLIQSRVRCEGFPGQQLNQILRKRQL
jgi:hypothetical protein